MKQRRIQLLSQPIKGTLAMPGSKSYTNRALLLATLIPQRVMIKNPLFSDDTRAMINCLQTLGIAITIGEQSIEVVGSYRDIVDQTYELDAHLSGTTIRFILALAAMVPGKKIISGKEGLNKRPIHDLVDGLRQLGATITYLEQEGFPPMEVSTTRLQPGITGMKGSVSSQYFSALLMVAPLIGETTIEVQGEQISKPYIDMTIDTMAEFNITVQNEHYQRYHIPAKQRYHKNAYTVEGDFSSAGYLLAFAALTKSTLTLHNLNPFSKQADRRLLAVLREMGSTIKAKEQQITIIGGGVKPLLINAIDFPDQVQTLAVLAAFADGVTTIRGVQSLRVKETERVIALQQELKKMGIKTKATHDTLTIYGGKPHGASIATYGDHRMAMSFAIAGTVLPGIEILDPDVVDKTFPTFWDTLQQIGITTTEEAV